MTGSSRSALLAIFIASVVPAGSAAAQIVAEAGGRPSAPTSGALEEAPGKRTFGYSNAVNVLLSRPDTPMSADVLEALGGGWELGHRWFRVGGDSPGAPGGLPGVPVPPAGDDDGALPGVPVLPAADDGLPGVPVLPSAAEDDGLPGDPVLPSSGDDGLPGVPVYPASDDGGLPVDAVVRVRDDDGLPGVPVLSVDEGDGLPGVPVLPLSEDDGLPGVPVGAPAENKIELGQTVEIRTPSEPGVWLLESGSGTSVTVITQVPASRAVGGRLNGYNIGYYPAASSGRNDAYTPPDAFVEVTPENRDLAVSKHLTLAQFLTKDQFDIWPKYVALDSRLLDKLELVMQELNAMGVRAERLYVMSGFRTPQYNGPGGDGRASLSRHMWGDAADIWVDNDGDGVIDDLNGDGFIDTGDAAVMLRAVERVERRYPELVGGAGVYPANSAHGPFIHIDARGHHSRW